MSASSHGVRKQDVQDIQDVQEKRHLFAVEILVSLYPVYEQDIQDVQDVQDEEACGSRSVSLVMKPLILAILSVLAILLGFLLFW